MKRTLTASVVLLISLGAQAQTFVDLTSLLNVDTVLESGGAGIGTPPDPAGRRIDAGTLPAGYTDGSPFSPADGRSPFTFAPLRQSSQDALAIDGQTLDVVDGSYGWLDLAMMGIPEAMAYPFTTVELRYTDATSEQHRFGPIAGWFASPTAYDHTIHRYTDSTAVQTLISFRTDFGAAEAAHIIQERGNGNSDGNRFVDGNGYALYWIEVGALTAGKLGVTVGNNFVVSIATDYFDPDVSTTQGYTVVANSMVIHDGFEHRALGNYKQYDIDLAPYLDPDTGDLFILFTDATPENGWGPYINQIQVFTGTPNVFEAALDPAVDASGATVHAMFRTATDEEKPFLYDNSGSGPSNRGHRFADGSQSITYRFDLPDDVPNASLTVDMANNFIVSLSGASDSTRYFNVGAATTEEAAFLIDSGGSIAGNGYRFADGSAYMIYRFDLPNTVTQAVARINVGNQFVLSAAAGDEDEFVVEQDWVAESGQETRDNSNLAFYYVNLTPYLADNPEKIVRIRLTDGLPSDGWGPYLTGIAIQSSEDTGSMVFTPVLNAQTLFNEDIRTEYNKRYYTLDLASVLAANPTKECFVRFTDGSTSDGWGPGIFWMAVHSGAIDIRSDRLVFPELRTTQGTPTNHSVNLFHRRYPVDPTKTLASVVLPSHHLSQTNHVYLLAATLNQPGAVEGPALTASVTSQGKIRFAWPAAAAAFKLESTPNLGAAASWSEVEDPAQIEGESLVLELDPADPARYYRLVK